MDQTREFKGNRPQAEPTDFKDLAPDEVIRSENNEFQQSPGAELIAKIMGHPQILKASSSDLLFTLC